MIRHLSLYEDDLEDDINIEIPPTIITGNNTIDYPDAVTEMHFISPKDEGEMDLEPKHQLVEIPAHSSKTSGKLKSSDSIDKRARIGYIFN